MYEKLTTDVENIVMKQATESFGKFFRGDAYSHTYGWLYKYRLRVAMAIALNELRHETLDIGTRERYRRALFVYSMRRQTEEEAYIISHAIPMYQQEMYRIANSD